MNVGFRKSFERDLKKLRDRTLLNSVKTMIESVENADTLDTISNLKKLKGEDGYFRVRIGDYRLGLFWDGDTLLFVRILHRREFYRYFP